MTRKNTKKNLNFITYRTFLSFPYFYGTKFLLSKLRSVPIRCHCEKLGCVRGRGFKWKDGNAPPGRPLWVIVIRESTAVKGSLAQGDSPYFCANGLWKVIIFVISRGSLSQIFWRMMPNANNPQIVRSVVEWRRTTTAQTLLSHPLAWIEGSKHGIVEGPECGDKSCRPISPKTMYVGDVTTASVNSRLRNPRKGMLQLLPQTNIEIFSPHWE